MQKVIGLLFIVLTFGGCGNVVTSSATGLGCQTGSVYIQIRDGLFQPLCGCQEIAGQVSPESTATLTCTFGRGASVIFDFSNTRLQHQVRFASGSQLSDSPLFNMSDSSSPSTYGVIVSEAGTFNFYDSVNPTMTGSLISL